jgi:hypothetical protein
VRSPSIGPVINPATKLIRSQDLVISGGTPIISRKRSDPVSGVKWDGGEPGIL